MSSSQSVSSPLSPSTLLGLLPALLPPSAPTLTSPHDALVAFLHTIHISLGFRFASAAAYTNDRVLADDWNRNGPDSYKLEYKHEQSSLNFLVKVTTMGSKAIIHAMAVEVSRPHSGC